MGRHPKSYEPQLTAVLDMAPGSILVIKKRKPWGLTHKIYAMLRELDLSSFYKVRTDKEAGRITVTKEGGPIVVYDEEREEDEWSKHADVTAKS